MMLLLTLKMQKLRDPISFLEKEHTQNANDSIHSTTERAKWEMNMQYMHVQTIQCKSDKPRRNI